jgi:hypothetical protein
VLYAILAAAVATGCVSATARQAWRLARRERPGSAQVLERIRGTKSGDRNADWLWELDELMIEVDGVTRAPAELSHALARASLASGTALAVLTLASAPDLAHLPEAGVSFGVGVVGAAGATYFGRLAKVYSARARSHWTEVARAVRRSIENAQGPESPAGESVDGL